MGALETPIDGNCGVDTDSCATTEIDSDSDIDDANQGESEAKHRKFSVDGTTTLRFWKGLTNMAHHINLVDHIPEITWHLPEPAEACDIFHGTRHIRGIVNMCIRKFKIGITGNPANRWSNRRYGYQHQHYSGMNVIYVFDSSDDVATVETALIGGITLVHSQTQDFRYIALI